MPSFPTPGPLAPQPPSSREEEYLRAEEAEIACWRAALLAPSVRVRASLGLRVHENAWGVALICAGADHVLFNRVFLRHAPGGGRLQELQTLLRLHRREGVARYFVHVKESEESSLLCHLQNAGLERYPRSWVKLGAPISRSSSSPGTNRAREGSGAVSVRPIATREAARFAELFRTGFQLPEALDAVYQALVGSQGFSTVGAFIEGRLSAAGISYHHGHTAYLAGGVTAPSSRRRGLQSALIAARQNDAVARNCRAWCTETGEEVPDQPQHSERNLQRHGLRRLGLRHNFAPPGCTW